MDLHNIVMIQNQPENEYGRITAGYYVELSYRVYKNEDGKQTEATVSKSARFELDPYPSCAARTPGDSHADFFASLLSFQKSANSIFREAKRLLKGGRWVDFSISVGRYEHVKQYTEWTPAGSLPSTLRSLSYNRWTFSGDNCTASEGDCTVSLDSRDSDEDGLYLVADKRYTEESHDMFLPWKQDILKSLAEAQI